MADFGIPAGKKNASQTSNGEERAPRRRGRPPGRTSDKRRTLSLCSASRHGMQKIKDVRGISSDAAAIKDALEVRARVANRDIAEIEQALQLLDLAKQQRQAGNAYCCFVPGDQAKRIWPEMPDDGSMIWLGTFSA